MALMLSLNAGAAGVQPRHRHHPQTEQLTTPANKPIDGALPADTAHGNGIELYSDTSSVAMPVSADSVYDSQSYSFNMDDNSVASEIVRSILDGTIGVGGALIAITVVLGILLCLLAPWIVLIFLFRYLINRHNSKVSLAEKAMETGAPLPHGVEPVNQDSSNYYLRRGIKNAAIGVGLVIMFGIWGSDMLMGIGAVVACYGLGQIIIAKKAK